MKSLEPTAGIEPATYALRKHAIDLDVSVQKDSKKYLQNHSFVAQIMAKLAEKILIILRAATSPCYTGATQTFTEPSDPVEAKQALDSKNKISNPINQKRKRGKNSMDPP